MNLRLLVLLLYALVTVGVGLTVRKKASRSRVEFFLAGRSLNKPLLFFTMTATNFSAFTIFGFSGAGYRMGYSFYPVMGFGTGFMAIGLYLVGSRVLPLSKQYNYITPSDFIQHRYGSAFLKKLFSAVMIVFTLPYLAIQAIASGKSLESLVGIPYIWGAFLVTAFIVLYVVLGGMRSDVWTDVLQGILMVGCTFAAFAIIARATGGFVRTNERAAESFPLLFSRPGLDGSMGMGVWFGYLLLWFFADPMFPQLFQRCMAARDRQTLHTTVVFYPIITTFLFFLTVSIGVMGRVTFPDLPVEKSDSIFPLLLGRYTGPVLSTFLLLGGLAALMSTMDSQLLTMASMITLDFFRIEKKEMLKQKLTIIVLGALGFLIALKPPATILDFINRSSFYGLAVLAPAVMGGLYWKRANRYGAIASIVAGEVMVFLFYFKVVQVPGFLPVIPIMVVTGAVFAAGSLLFSSAGENTGIASPLGKGSLLWITVFSIFFVLALDFWNWGRRPVMFQGLPLWVWYYAGLGLALAAALKLFTRSRESAH